MTLLHIVVGGYTDALTTLSFDGAALKSTSKLQAENASWVVAHPVAEVWFTTSEVDPGFVRVLKFEGGKGEVLESVATGGIHPTHIAVSADGTELFVANYSSGDMSVMPVLPSAPYLAAASGLVKFAYVPPAPGEPQAGFNPGRQEGSHPHQVLVVRDEVLVPDLGSDKVWRLQKVDGKYAVVGFIAFPRGSGPRHAYFKDGVLYTVCELSNQLAAHQFPPLPEHAAHISTLPTLPTPEPAVQKKVLMPSELAYTSSLPPTPAPTDATTDLVQPAQLQEATEPPPPALAAEILCPPPHDYIYVSNRNEPHAAGDSIAVFTPHPDFKLVHRVHTGVQHLRAVAFEPREGKYLALAGQNGGGVRVFERRDGGQLVPVESAYVAAGGDGVDGPEKITSVTWI